MRFVRLAAIAALSAACSSGTTATHPGGEDSGYRVADHGVSLRVPPGWTTQSLRGRLTLENFAGSHTPGQGQVWAAIDELSLDPRDPIGFPFPRLEGNLRIRPGQYPSPEWKGGDLGAARLFAAAGRHFELMVVYGDRHPSGTVVHSLDAALSTLIVHPGNHYLGTLEPPRFAHHAGWRVGSSAATHERPEGDQLCAWASTIRYRDSNTCPIPSFTIDALPPGGMVISVDKYRDWNPPRGAALPAHPVVPNTITVMAEGGYRSATLTGTTPDRTTVEIDVYIGRHGRFTPAMRQRAQTMLDQLNLPAWPG
jgi:hypothetical protein